MKTEEEKKKQYSLTDEERKLLQEIAIKIRGRELFRESNERMRWMLDNAKFISE